MKIRLKKQYARYARLHDLTADNVYRVIGISADYYRILNDLGRPYLHPAKFFRVVDPTEPIDWQTSYGEDGERYSYPPGLGCPGFFEDFFDDVPRAILAFNACLANLETRAHAAPQLPVRPPRLRGRAKRDTATS